jgi:hypothetical protein
MRRDVQIFVNNQRLDLFDFEDINIVDSIQDVRDIGKLFVPFSREFTVPASKNNNKVFKHYYNQSITNSFDARFKVSAVIKINGSVYKKGRITLLGASLKNDKPYNYKLIFYDTTIDLKTSLGDKMLSDINSETLNKYIIDYDAVNVLWGFSYGWNLVGGVMVYDDILPNEIDDKNNPKDLIFPFISANNYYFYDTNDAGLNPIQGDSESRNISPTASTEPRGLNYRDLRGGIRLPILLNALSEDTSININFAGSFFSESNEEFNRLYLYLQRERGLYESNAKESFLLSEMTFDIGTLLSSPIVTTPIRHYTVEILVTPLDSSDDYNIDVFNTVDGANVYSSTGKGTNIFVFDIKSTDTEPTKSYILNFVLDKFTSATVFFDVMIQEKISFFGGNKSYYSKTITSVNRYSVVSELPKIKIIDLLTSLFNMFNLTGYVDLDGNIVVETLDTYYNNGNEIPITRHVDTSTTEVTRNKLYSEIAFEFEEASTFAAVNSNELFNDEFGNEKISNTSDDEDLRNILAFDGGKYEVSPKLEKIQYERMTDQTTGDATDVAWGWLVDKDQKAVLTKPFLFYAENITLTTPSFINFEYDGAYLEPVQYYRPSNSLSNGSVHGQSLNFGSENDEFYIETGGGNNEVSLFNRYWKNYVLSIYDEQARIVTIKANLPVSIINTIRLNNVLVIRGKKYRINKLDINITNGDTKLELITYNKIESFYNDAYRVDIDTITVDSDLITVDSR